MGFSLQVTPRVYRTGRELCNHGGTTARRCSGCAGCDDSPVSIPAAGASEQEKIEEIE
jgi:hypothetical protein